MGVFSYHEHNNCQRLDCYSHSNVIYDPSLMTMVKIGAPMKGDVRAK